MKVWYKKLLLLATSAMVGGSSAFLMCKYLPEPLVLGIVCYLGGVGVSRLLSNRKRRLECQRCMSDIEDEEDEEDEEVYYNIEEAAHAAQVYTNRLERLIEEKDCDREIFNKAQVLIAGLRELFNAMGITRIVN